MTTRRRPEGGGEERRKRRQQPSQPRPMRGEGDGEERAAGSRVAASCEAMGDAASEGGAALRNSGSCSRDEIITVREVFKVV